MTKLKNFLIAACLICLCVGLSACNNSESDPDISELSPADITEAFFSAFESSDYETMKSYCTESCIEDYFHGDNVFGMIWAKAVNIEKEPVVSEYQENKVYILVSVEMETAKTSALYPESETSFFVVLEEVEEDSFLIDGFVTGL
jgi:hypothetical protein